MKRIFKTFVCTLSAMTIAAALGGCQSVSQKSESTLLVYTDTGSSLITSSDSVQSSYDTVVSKGDADTQNKSTTDPSSNNTETEEPVTFESDVTPDKGEGSQIVINISVGDTVLNCVLYDTELAGEIAENMPFTVSMDEYIGREYYGRLDFTPQTAVDGQLYFETGDLSYCPSLNSLAVFYTQTDQTDLTIEVIPIGKITSGFSVFNSLESREDVTFSIAALL
ncbi:MAG: hypothetical protein K2J80_09570 [Oscillospiraceae bacterium]|nr:hypothetical protein [Oscillospiraceae bacterium]